MTSWNLKNFRASSRRSAEFLKCQKRQRKQLGNSVITKPKSSAGDSAGLLNDGSLAQHKVCTYNELKEVDPRERKSIVSDARLASTFSTPTMWQLTALRSRLVVNETIDTTRSCIRLRRCNPQDKIKKMFTQKVVQFWFTTHTYEFCWILQWVVIKCRALVDDRLHDKMYSRNPFEVSSNALSKNILTWLISVSLTVKHLPIKYSKPNERTVQMWPKNCKMQSSITLYLPEELRESSNPKIIGKFHHIRTLGIQGNPNQDALTFTVNLDEMTTYTKRTSFSDTSKLFDPNCWDHSKSGASAYFEQYDVFGLDWNTNLPEHVKKKSWLHMTIFPECCHSTFLASITRHQITDLATFRWYWQGYLPTCTVEPFQRMKHFAVTKTRVAPVKTINRNWSSLMHNWAPNQWEQYKNYSDRTI